MLIMCEERKTNIKQLVQLQIIQTLKKVSGWLHWLHTDCLSTQTGKPGVDKLNLKMTLCGIKARNQA